jgi:hypothetical protein
LQHFFERIPRYYREPDAVIARAILDCLAHCTQSLSLDGIFQKVQAQLRTNDLEPTRNLLRLLQRDHYVVQTADGSFQFALPLIKRAWNIQRPVS